MEVHRWPCDQENNLVGAKSYFHIAWGPGTGSYLGRSPTGAPAESSRVPSAFLQFAAWRRGRGVVTLACVFLLAASWCFVCSELNVWASGVWGSGTYAKKITLVGAPDNGWNLEQGAVVGWCFFSLSYKGRLKPRNPRMETW